MLDVVAQQTKHKAFPAAEPRRRCRCHHSGHMHPLQAYAENPNVDKRKRSAFVGASTKPSRTSEFVGTTHTACFYGSRIEDYTDVPARLHLDAHGNMATRKRLIPKTSHVSHNPPAQVEFLNTV